MKRHWYAGSLVLSVMIPTLVSFAEASAPGSEARVRTIEEVIRDAREDVETIDNEQLSKRIVANPKLVLIDVRTKQEFDAGHLKGATWIERGVLEFTLARTLRDPDAEIILYCGKSNRSALAAKALKRMGYRNVRSHLGFEAWVEAGLPFHNFLGEARMIKLAKINAATTPIDLYQDKKW
jgi:rhodanese-related sulfurtransferase